MKSLKDSWLLQPLQQPQKQQMLWNSKLPTIVERFDCLNYADFVAEKIAFAGYHQILVDLVDAAFVVVAVVSAAAAAAGSDLDDDCWCYLEEYSNRCRKTSYYCTGLSYHRSPSSSSSSSSVPHSPESLVMAIKMVVWMIMMTRISLLSSAGE